MKTYELVGQRIAKIGAQPQLRFGDRIKIQTPFDNRAYDIISRKLTGTGAHAVFENGGRSIRVLAPGCTEPCMVRIFLPDNDIHLFDDYDQFSLKVVDVCMDVNGMHHLVITGKFHNMSRAPRIPLRSIVLLTPWINEECTIESMV